MIQTRDTATVVQAWQDALRGAVSPLSDGVQHLRIEGFAADATLMMRPERTAAVLVAILDRPKPQLVLTRRAEHLSHHPGQISFPGGSAERDDASAVNTALREAREEIGLQEQSVEPIGFLDRIDTISGFRVLPVVGLATAPLKWALDRSEVDEVFELPLERALDKSAYREKAFERDGVRRMIYSMEWEKRVIWGVTASILLNLAQRVEAFLESSA